eukprot:703921-Pelagomonas_calceolata.AAC.1
MDTGGPSQGGAGAGPGILPTGEVGCCRAKVTEFAKKASQNKRLLHVLQLVEELFFIAKSQGGSWVGCMSKLLFSSTLVHPIEQQCEVLTWLMPS